MNKDSKQQPPKAVHRHDQDATQLGGGVTRREFLQTSAVVAGLGMGLGGVLVGCHDDDKDNGGGNGKEVRTYLFDFSQMDTSNHDMVMVAGRVHATLKPVTAGKLRSLRISHPILEMLPDERATHWIALKMPATAIQLCYCQRISHATTDGSWDMAMLFYHFPRSGLHGAKARQQDMLSPGELPPIPVKWGRYGVTAEQLVALADPGGEDMLKDWETASARFWILKP